MRLQALYIPLPLYLTEKEGEGQCLHAEEMNIKMTHTAVQYCSLYVFPNCQGLVTHKYLICLFSTLAAREKLIEGHFTL